MRQLPSYPWDLMQPYIAKAAAHPDGKIDLSVGSPVDTVAPSVQKALAESADSHAYPATAGSTQLLEAIADWYYRRRAVKVAPAGVLPTVGSKELVALLPFLLNLGPADAVVFPEIAYPSYQMGAALVGAQAIAADNPQDWPANTKLVWLNSPANPHGQVLDQAAMRERVVRARQLGAVVASDECYAELGWDEWADKRIPCVLDSGITDTHEGLLSVYSLSKQSNLAGYRAAFIAGDQKLIAALLNVRKHMGLMVPYPVQQAMIAALTDDIAVAAQRQRYAQRRQVLLAALQAAGWRIDHSEAGLYIWATKGLDCWDSIAELAALGIIAGPGIFYGQSGQKYVRFALSASDEMIAAAAMRLTGQNNSLENNH